MESEGRKMGVRIDVLTAKYITMSPTQVKRYLYVIVIDDFKLEGHDSFTYLGSVLGNGNKHGQVFFPQLSQQTAHNQHMIPFPVLNFCHKILN
jgi:hypothetical protein